MNDHAIIAGSFSDLKLIKTRSVAQLIIEIPIEHADEALERLGGVPQSGKEKPVAVARLNVDVARTSAPQASEKPMGWRDADGDSVVVDKHRLSRQAALCCQDARFRAYVAEKFLTHVKTETDARDFVRGYCVVNSRSELDSNPVAARRWERLYSNYIAWREAA